MRDRLSPPPTRREMLHLAAAGVTAGTAVGWFRRWRRGAAAPPSKPRSCILLWLSGGPSQLDTFDMKPDAGSKYRGEFKPVATNVPGIQVCELLPRVARHMDKLALLRGMSTGEAEHRRAHYLMQSGYRELPGTHHPNLGAIASAEIGRPDFELPNFMWLGSPAIAGAGYLGGKHGIVRVGQIHDEVEPQPGERPAPPAIPPVRQAGRVARPPRGPIRRAVPRPGDGRRPPGDVPPGAPPHAVGQTRGLRPAARADPRPRVLRRHPVRQGLPPGPPARRGGRALRRRHPRRFRHAQRQLEAAPPPPAGPRLGDVRPAGRSRDAGPARQYARHLHGRVRPGPHDQQHQGRRRPRTLRPRAGRRSSAAEA